VIDHICRHVGDPLTIPVLAKAGALSESRLSHLFRSQVGMTPIQYVDQQRMRKARELLELSSFTVGEIADLVGYASPYYFSRRFSAYTGVPPREYRRRHQH
jgi:AraC family transcriptional regulator of arabinose operon